MRGVFAPSTSIQMVEPLKTKIRDRLSSSRPPDRRPDPHNPPQVSNSCTESRNVEDGQHSIAHQRDDEKMFDAAEDALGVPGDKSTA